MTSWPLEIDGREFQPVPESWIDHGDDHDAGSPRLFAVSAAHVGRSRLFVRYAHPADNGVYVATMESTELDSGGVVPTLLADGSWPRSLVPPREIEASDVVRDLERQHMREVWPDRDPFPLPNVDDDRQELVADGGPIKCDRCDDAVDPENHKIHVRPDGVAEDLCLVCQTRVPNHRLYSPDEGGSA